MSKIRCLWVSVFRDARFGDCSNGGVSSRFSELLVACPNGPFEFDSDVAIPLNFCRVRERYLWGKKVYDVRPATVSEEGKVVDRDDKWRMFGGNFAFTSDSRFSDLCGGLGYGAVAIHDRIE